MNRCDLENALWDSQKQFCYVEKEEYLADFSDWLLDPLLNDDGSLAAIFIVNGPEFHFVSMKTGRTASRSILIKYPGSLISRYGFATTRTLKEDVRQQRFNEAIGFVKVGEDEQFIHYQITELRGGRSCQQ